MSQPDRVDAWAAEVTRALGAVVELGTGGPPAVVVESARWVESLRTARDLLGLTYFDFLTAVDADPDGIEMVAHLADVRPRPLRSLLVKAALPVDSPVIGCACCVFEGAGWHERETHEMFGVEFEGHGPLEPLLLPPAFEGHPLRKGFILASRLSRPWPGAKEPGESGDPSQSERAPTGAARPRRRPRPPGVPEPGTWPRGEG